MCVNVDSCAKCYKLASISSSSLSSSFQFSSFSKCLYVHFSQMHMLFYLEIKLKPYAHKCSFNLVLRFIFQLTNNWKWSEVTYLWNTTKYTLQIYHIYGAHVCVVFFFFVFYYMLIQIENIYHTHSTCHWLLFWIFFFLHRIFLLPFNRRWREKNVRDSSMFWLYIRRSEILNTLYLSHPYCHCLKWFWVPFFYCNFNIDIRLFIFFFILAKTFIKTVL